jgi:hypothetical protein
MHVARAEDDLVRKHELRGREHERILLRAAHPSVRSDELFERGDFLHVGPVGRVDHDVRDVRKSVRAKHLRGRVRAERRERIITLDAAFVEIVHTAFPDRDRAALFGADEEKGDPRVLPERRDEERIALFELLQRHSLGNARKRDETEVPGRERHDLRQLVRSVA